MLAREQWAEKSDLLAPGGRPTASPPPLAMGL